MSEKYEVCDDCPMLRALDATEPWIEDHSDFYRGKEDNQSAALGLVAIRREILTSVADQAPCPGPALDHDQQFVCPIGIIVNNAVDAAVGPNEQVKANFCYGSVVGEKEKDVRPGGFL